MPRMWARLLWTSHLNLFIFIHPGVLGDGDFLIAATDKDGPRVAIVGSNGQFRRFVKLTGDVHAPDESDKPGRQKDPTALPRIASGDDAEGSYLDVLYRSQIAGDGPNLLCFAR